MFGAPPSAKKSPPVAISLSELRERLLASQDAGMVWALLDPYTDKREARNALPSAWQYRSFMYLRDIGLAAIIVKR